MKIKFQEFLNEYGGPGKTIGFRYSEPEAEYGVIVPMIVSDSVNIPEMDLAIETILQNNKVFDGTGDEYYKFKQVNTSRDGKSPYTLEINMKGYSKYELKSMITVVLDELSNLYDDELIILVNQIQSKGPDLEPNKKKLGYM